MLIGRKQGETDKPLPHGEDEVKVGRTGGGEKKERGDTGLEAHHP